MDIVGRSGELRALHRMVDRAPGAPAGLVLHGGPGTGKTALLRACTGYARERGVRVLGACGHESEARLAFAGLHQLLAPVMAYADRVGPYHRTVLRRVLGFEEGPPPDPLAVPVATLALLAAVAEDGPVLVAVEDAHRVDGPTSEVLMFVLLRLEAYDLRAVLARRAPGAANRMPPGVGTLDVRPLGRPDAEELLDRLHPGLEQWVRERTLGEAAGNPLALAELPAAIAREEAPRLEAGHARRAAALSPRLRTALLLAAPDELRAAHAVLAERYAGHLSGRPREPAAAAAGPVGSSTDVSGPATRARVLMLRDGDLAGARRLLDRVPSSYETPRAVEARVLAAACTQDPRDWARVRALITAQGRSTGPGTRLLHGVLDDLPRTGHGLAPLLHEAFAGLPADPPPEQVVELCRAAAGLDLLHDYRAHVRDLVARQRGAGAVTHAAGYWLAAHDHFLSGEWGAAEQAAHTGLELCVRHDLQLPAHDLRCALGRIAAARGDVAGARAYSRTVEQWAAPRGSTLHLTLSARNLALAALSAGDYETAYLQCERVSPAGTLAPHRLAAPWLVLDLVDAAVRTGRTDAARAHLAAAEAASLADLTPRLRLHVLGARALTASGAEAVGLFRTALALPQTERWPFDHARVRLALGELLRRLRRPGDARPELRRAADVFARIGASAWHRRAEQELRASGVAVLRQRRPAEAPGLTSQQLEVARLAATGLTNKQIASRLHLSPRTIGAHLYRTFPKLGITSRSALRDALTTSAGAATDSGASGPGGPGSGAR
ncbi:LuxR family transcriptional regulator [Streptomyces sp. NPDC051940]|uniref:helix-turn-helix transcriptional regulator n=1 Tax=Streptomyces sp. NPDC051940 TaxID=3155675 RepID=UPI003421D0F9